MMKTIGTLQNGSGFLVEVTNSEHYAFSKLVDALRGKTWRFDMPIPHDVIDYDMAVVFEYIKSFAIAKFRVNELRETINDLEARIQETE